MKARSSHPSDTSDRQHHVLDATLSVFSADSQRHVAVMTGLCVPKGRLMDVHRLAVSGPGLQLLAQADVLNRWSDGSVRWLLASLLIPHLPGQNAVPGTIQPLQTSDASAIRTIPLRLVPVSPESESGAELMVLKHRAGELRVTTRRYSGLLPAESTVCIRPVVTGVHGEELPLLIEHVRQEVCGPVRQVAVVLARLKSHRFVTVQLRLTHWIDSGLLHLETRLRNTRRARHDGGLWDLGDPGSFLFRGLELHIRHRDLGAQATCHWRAERDLPMRRAADGSVVRIRQHGSGGRWWNSRNHVSADNQCHVRERGYEAMSPAGMLRGYRAEPLMAVGDNETFLAVTMPEFWQQFPSGLEAQHGRITAGLFPQTDSVPWELQGGEQKTRAVWLATGTGTPDAADLDWTFRPPCLLQAPEAISEADVFPWFPGRMPPDTSAADDASTAAAMSSQHNDWRRLARYLRQATTGSYSVSARREKIDEYGWRHFGDVPADHEQTHFAGSGTVVSHYNNQFDLICGGILQMASSGDPSWISLFDPLARHVMDIDIYHTDEDRAAYNGGLFWHTDHYVDARSSTHRTYSVRNQPPGAAYGGGPGCEHNYTTGLLYYYFLTGHPEAHQAVLSLAEWVLRMDDGNQTVFCLLDNGPTGYASATMSEDFHGPGRGAGNSINALLDAWILTRSTRFMEKAEELIRRCVHPRQDLEALQLSDAEHRWSYTVFLNALSRYLLIRQEAGALDGMSAWARDVMSHYGRWMAVHEVRTLSHPERLQYPTEAWAAQDFRKANVLRLAAACEDDPEQAALMRTRAQQLSNEAWEDLYAFGQQHLTARCLAILMTEGQRDVFHRSCPPTVVPRGATTYPDSNWTMFIPQKARVRALLRSPSRLLRAVISAIHPQRCRRAVRALWRQL